MRICDKIKPESQTIKWVKDQFEDDNLYVDNGFQRRYVWLRKHQVKLIETILMGYVIPEIYIWRVGTNPDTGETKFSIVDGQQRIGAIVDFINGKFPLTRIYLTDDKAPYAGKYFSELSPEDKKSIWGYSLSFRSILEDVSREDIKNLFLRLNSTDKSLNPQELRNAEYDGLFIRTALEIANFSFWSKYGVFSTDALRRMGDIEFISGILIFLRSGIAYDLSQDSINEIYDLYNEKYDEAEDDKHAVKMMLDEIDRIIQLDKQNVIKSYIKKNTHLYTIMICLYKYLAKEDKLNEEYVNNLISFYRKYEESQDNLAIEYRTLFQGATRSKANRMGRVKILCDVIEGRWKA